MCKASITKVCPKKVLKPAKNGVSASGWGNTPALLVDIHHFQFAPCSQKWGRIEINPWVWTFFARRECPAVTYTPTTRIDLFLFFGKLEWIRPLLLKLLVACSTKAAAVAFCLPPPHYAARGTLALGARAATIDQVGSFKRVIVYGASAPRRALPDGGSLFKLVHVQHCFNLGN